MTDGRTEKVAAVGEAAVVMGIELSKKGWLVALRSPLADRISLHRFPTRLATAGDIAQDTAEAVRRPAGCLTASTFTQIVAHIHPDCRRAGSRLPPVPAAGSKSAHGPTMC
jgi:hypothetical protein